MNGCYVARRQNPAYSDAFAIPSVRPLQRAAERIFFFAEDRPEFHLSLRFQDPYCDHVSRLNPDVNPYVATLIEDSTRPDSFLKYGAALRDLRGRWLDHFRQRRPQTCGVIAEIGCHRGDVLNAIAHDFPHWGLVGLDITFKRVVLSARKAEASENINVRSVLANARSLDMIFAPRELDGLIVFFPDPWVKKKRQQKHRLIDEKFINMASSVVKPGGIFWLKTDQEPYFKAACHLLQTHGFSAREGQGEPLGRSYESLFERRFRANNIPTFGRQFVRADAKLAKNQIVVD